MTTTQLCDTCDGEGEIPLWPVWACSAREIAAGLHRQTMECPDCAGSGREDMDDWSDK